MLTGQDNCRRIIMSFLEKSWEEREEKVYKKLFGDLGPGIYPLDIEIFTKKFKQDNCDPRWLHYGVFKSKPNENRETWLYISSGMSNPWESEQPKEYSGFGTELVLEAREDANWAIDVVRTMVAYSILLAHGRMGDFPMLDYGHRIPFKILPDNDEPPTITHVIIAEPDHYQHAK
ncbi:suppressor of fused domain protein [Desulfobacter curvatus]|uniref:suppressor of fused domain protein n=1 Tax=Desulfobacter curvatus TaxID=2290 RepID=UPI000364BF95|nr:suppressor of fused domain protein [Desulfobacter curvatus]